MLLTPWLLLAALLYVIYDWLHYNITRPNKGPWGLPLLYSLHSVIVSPMSASVRLHSLKSSSPYPSTICRCARRAWR